MYVYIYVNICIEIYISQTRANEIHTHTYIYIYACIYIYIYTYVYIYICICVCIELFVHTCNTTCDTARVSHAQVTEALQAQGLTVPGAHRHEGLNSPWRGFTLIQRDHHDTLGRYRTGNRDDLRTMIRRIRVKPSASSCSSTQ